MVEDQKISDMMYGGEGHEDTWTDCALNDLTKYGSEDKFHCLEVEGADGVDVSTQTTKVPKLIAMAYNCCDVLAF